MIWSRWTLVGVQAADVIAQRRFDAGDTQIEGTGHCSTPHRQKMLEQISLDDFWMLANRHRVTNFGRHAGNGNFALLYHIGQKDSGLHVGVPG